MKNKKQIAIALMLAFAGVSAQAAGLDIKFDSAPAQAEKPPIAQGVSNANALGAGVPQAPVAAVTPVKNAPPAPAATKVNSAPPANSFAGIAESAKNMVNQAASAIKPAPAQPASAVKAAPAAQPAPIARPAPVAEAAPVSAPVAMAPVSQTPAAAPAPAPAPTAAPASEANPFTGRTVSLEQRQREIEMAKLETDLLQERVKQAALAADLTYLPVKKHAEVSMLPNVKMQRETKEAKEPAKESAKEQEVVKKPVRAPKKKKSDEPVIMAPTAPVEAPLTVSSISINGSNASVVLESQGNIVSARHGDSSPYGAVRVIDSRTVMVGGRQLKVKDAVLSRMTISDPVVLDPQDPRAAAVKQATPLPTPGSPMGSAAPQGNQPLLAPLPSLPPPPMVMDR